MNGTNDKIIVIAILVVNIYICKFTEISLACNLLFRVLGIEPMTLDHNFTALALWPSTPACCLFAPLTMRTRTVIFV